MSEGERKGGEDIEREKGRWGGGWERGREEGRLGKKKGDRGK